MRSPTQSWTWPSQLQTFVEELDALAEVQEKLETGTVSLGIRAVGIHVV